MYTNMFSLYIYICIYVYIYIYIYAFYFHSFTFILYTVYFIVYIFSKTVIMKKTGESTLQQCIYYCFRYNYSDARSLNYLTSAAQTPAYDVNVLPDDINVPYMSTFLTSNKQEQNETPSSNGIQLVVVKSNDVIQSSSAGDDVAQPMTLNNGVSPAPCPSVTSPCETPIYAVPKLVRRDVVVMSQPYSSSLRLKLDGVTTDDVTEATVQNPDVIPSGRQDVMTLDSQNVMTSEMQDVTTSERQDRYKTMPVSGDEVFIDIEPSRSLQVSFSVLCCFAVGRHIITCDVSCRPSHHHM